MNQEGSKVPVRYALNLVAICLLVFLSASCSEQISRELTIQEVEAFREPTGEVKLSVQASEPAACTHEQFLKIESNEQDGTAIVQAKGYMPASQTVCPLIVAVYHLEEVLPPFVRRIRFTKADGSWSEVVVQE